MIVAFPLAFVVTALIVWRRRSAAGGRGWRWFGAWAFAGGLFVFSLLTGFTIGLFIFPAVAALLFLVAAHAPHLREALGTVAGVGAVLLLVAFLNRDYDPCPPHGRLSVPPGTPPGTGVSCGGLDPAPWLQGGVALSLAGVLAYAILGRAAKGR